MCEPRSIDVRNARYTAFFDRHLCIGHCVRGRCRVCATYPTKPVRIVTAEPGGANDIAARSLAPGLTARSANR